MGVPIELEKLRKGTELVKRGFASMQKGGVIMDVVKPEQARIAEDAGAVAVMALEAVPSFPWAPMATRSPSESMLTLLPE